MSTTSEPDRAAEPARAEPARAEPARAEPARVEAGADCGAAVPAHPGRDRLQLADVLHALSDPVRLTIVTELARGGERRCGSFELPVVKSTCTHHFRVLREAGVIRQRLDGKTRLNSLRREDLEARFPGLVEAVLRARADQE